MSKYRSLLTNLFHIYYLHAMQTLLLLHGAIGASDQLKKLAGEMSSHCHIHTLDFTGHGGRVFGNEPFSMQLFVDNILHYLDENKLERVTVYGYSMGGYAAMCLAKQYPGRISKLITLATKYHWDTEIAVKESQMLNPEKIEQKVPAFAETLRARHHPNDWKEVLRKTSEMMLELGRDSPLKPGDYLQITIPVLVMLGDKDKMVSFEETVAVYRALPKAQMAVLPNTQHPIEQVDTEMLSFLIKGFLK